MGNCTNTEVSVPKRSQAPKRPQIVPREHEEKQKERVPRKIQGMLDIVKRKNYDGLYHIASYAESSDSYNYYLRQWQSEKNNEEYAPYKDAIDAEMPAIIEKMVDYIAKNHGSGTDTVYRGANHALGTAITAEEIRANINVLQVNADYEDTAFLSTSDLRSTNSDYRDKPIAMDIAIPKKKSAGYALDYEKIEEEIRGLGGHRELESEFLFPPSTKFTLMAQPDISGKQVKLKYQEK